MVQPGMRSAVVGEWCTCGRRAQLVLLRERFGLTGYCGHRGNGTPALEGCRFCGDAIDHSYYWDREAAAGRDSASAGPEGSQGGRCPQYRLRPDDPLPLLRPESVRRFDPATVRREQCQRAVQRLGAELHSILNAVTTRVATRHPAALAGPPATAPRGRGQHPAALRSRAASRNPAAVTDMVAGLTWGVQQALTGDWRDVTTHHARAGRDAVGALITALGDHFHELGFAPSPLRTLHRTDALIAAVGGVEVWRATIAHDRPLLLARRVVSRALDPDAPMNIYEIWNHEPQKPADPLGPWEPIDDSSAPASG